MSPLRYGSYWEKGKAPPSRVRIMDYLLLGGPATRWFSVQEVAEAVNISHTLANKQLENLYFNGYARKQKIRSRDTGKEVKGYQAIRPPEKGEMVILSLSPGDAEIIKESLERGTEPVWMVRDGDRSQRMENIIAAVARQLEPERGRPAV